METVPNCTLEVMRKSILKISKHYNQPRTVSTHTKLTQKEDHFTVFKRFPSTSCCSQIFPPNNLEKKASWMCGVISGRFHWVGGGGWTGRKRLQFKIVVGQ